MVISIVSLYKALRNKLGVESADELVEFVKSEMQTELKARTDAFLTNEDKIDLIEKMNKDKIDLIKWMFGFWITIVLLLLVNWFLKQ